jgi:hypothetical protein
MGGTVMADRLSDATVRELLTRARAATELEGFLGTLKTLAELCTAVEPLAAEVQRLRQRVLAYEQDLARAAALVRSKETESSKLYAEVEAIERRLAALHAA